VTNEEELYLVRLYGIVKECVARVGASPFYNPREWARRAAPQVTNDGDDERISLHQLRALRTYTDLRITYLSKIDENTV
jgi:hypothetical protein